MLVLLASNAVYAANNCDGAPVTLVHGASSTVTDSTTSPTLTSGAATATCNNGSLVYTGTSCMAGCGATTVNWGAGCTAAAPAILSGQNSALTNTDSDFTGTVTSSCANGVRSSSSAVCNANCNTQAVNWTISGKTCSALSGAMLTHGGSRSISDATQPLTGTRNISCSNGVLSQSGGTCVEQCGAQAVAWSQNQSNCAGTSALLNHGASGTVSDGAAPATGNVNVTCNNGVLSQSSAACSGTNNCAATTLNWTVGGRSCSDTVTLGTHSSSQALADTTANIAPGGTGTATATCSNGAWGTSSPVCNASCGTQTVSWSNCDASSGAILTHSGSRSITNTTSGYVGTRNIQCNNGSIAQSGGSCVAVSNKTFNVDTTTACVGGYCSCHTTTGVATVVGKGVQNHCANNGCLGSIVSFTHRNGPTGSDRRQCHGWGTGCFNNMNPGNYICRTITCGQCP